MPDPTPTPETPEVVPVVPGSDDVPADPTTGQPVEQPPADQPSGVEHPTLPRDRDIDTGPEIEPVDEADVPLADKQGA